MFRSSVQSITLGLLLLPVAYAQESRSTRHASEEKLEKLVERIENLEERINAMENVLASLGPQAKPGETSNTTDLPIPLEQSSTITIPKGITRVRVLNPQVCSVIPLVGGSQLKINATGKGTTTVEVLNSEGKLFRYVVSVPR